MIRTLTFLGNLLVTACTSVAAVNVGDPVVVGVGMKAPAFTVEQLNGIRFSLDDRPTIIWFFAPWCSYIGQAYPDMGRDCDNAATRLKRGHHTYGDQFQWIGLSVHFAVTTKSVGGYRIEHEIPFALAIDRGGDIYANYGVRYSPTVIIVDNGSIVFRAKANLERLDEKITELATN